jgi:hypothetical protein
MTARTWWEIHRPAYILALKAFLFGVLLHLAGHFGKPSLADWLADAMHVAGDAFIVAALLGITADAYLKRELLRDVGSIFIGWALPHEVRSYIREVSQTAILRRDYSVDFKLEPIGGDEVKVTVTLASSVFNYGTKAADYTTAMVVELAESPYEDEVRCVVTVGNHDEHWDSDRLRREARTEEDRVVKWAIKTAPLPPQDALDPSGAYKPGCKVVWTYAVRKHRDDDEWLAFGMPTLGVTVTASCPPELEFRCDHETGETTADGRWTWPFRDQFFMPGRCLHVRWNPAGSADNRHPGKITI